MRISTTGSIVGTLVAVFIALSGTYDSVGQAFLYGFLIGFICSGTGSIIGLLLERWVTARR